jgi:hypothetical protein
MLRRFGFLFNTAGDGGGGGGSGGDGKGDKSGPFSDDQLTAIGTMINGAITSKVPKLVTNGVADAMKAFDWKAALTPVVTELIPAPGSGGSGGGAGDDASKSKGGTIDPEVAKQLRTLTDKVEATEKLRLAAVQAAETLKQEHEFGSARQKLYEGLKTHASESLHDVWVDNLVHHKRLEVREGKPFLEVSHAAIKGMPKQKEFLPLDDAIAHLVAEEDAKRFLAVPGTGEGAGSRAPRGGNGNGGRAPALDSKDPAERVAARLAGMGVDFNTEFG